jgi:hypothetical protein
MEKLLEALSQLSDNEASDEEEGTQSTSHFSKCNARGIQIS